MRVERGGYAYELKLTPKGWKHVVYRSGVVRKELVESWCCSPTKDGAEREAQQVIVLLQAQDERNKRQAA